MRSSTIVVACLGLLFAVSGCDVNDALERQSEARRLSADLLVQFAKANDTASRAVMAASDEASAAYAKESRAASAQIVQDADALAPVLDGLKLSTEAGMLKDFRRQFAEYQTLDETILGLAVENTNVKASQLSFGAAQAAADEFSTALAAVKPRVPGDEWHVRALVAEAAVRVREIQSLQAPHIADPDDAAMTRLEQRMTAAADAARRSVAALDPLVQPASLADLTKANDALGRFMTVHQQIIGLSRRNTNVRSLALSLDQKAKLSASCERSLRALREAIAKHQFAGRA